MSWNDVGNFLSSSGSPWWATGAAPVLTFWIGQKSSGKATKDQRDWDATERDRDRTAETQRQREAADAEDKRARSDERQEAFTQALHAIAYLNAELAKSAVEYWGEADENGVSQLEMHPEAAVDTDAVRGFTGHVSRLRLYVTDEALDLDHLLSELSTYLRNWPIPGFRDRAEPLMAKLGKLSRDIGDLYRVRA